MHEELTEQFWQWVAAHISDDPATLRLKYGRDYDSAITQIECRRRFAKKLADILAANPHFLFPGRLQGEQSTSDLLASFHASLVDNSGPLADLTAGLGIDIIHCAPQGYHSVAVEMNPQTADALRYNLTAIGLDNIEVVTDDCRHFLADISDRRFATVFIDPARRGADGSRIFALSDCQPDVTAMLPDLQRCCRRLVVKMSPMLDITHTLGSLPGCGRIIALGTPTECRELIAVVDFDSPSNDPLIEAVTLAVDDQTEVSYQRSQPTEPLKISAVSEGDYLYEPYPAVMKAVPIRVLAAKYNLCGFDENTHLLHSDHLRSDFPGTVLKVERVIDFASKNIKRLRRDYPAISITTRNFGMTADALRRKLAVADGGNHRLFAVTSQSTRLMIITSA